MRKFRKPIRRRRFINPKVQLEIIGYFLVLPAIVLLFLYIEIKRCLSSSLEEFIRVQPQASDIGRLFFDLNSQNVQQLFLTHSLLILLFGITGGILISHRIVGPIYRVKTVLTRVRDGQEPGPVRFRKHDFFPEISQLLEDLLRRK